MLHYMYTASLCVFSRLSRPCRVFMETGASARYRRQSCVVCRLWRMSNRWRFGRKRSCPNGDAIQIFIWSILGKTQDVRRARVPVDIRKRPIPNTSSSSSSCSLRVRCIPCSLVLKVELVPPSLLRSSNTPSSFWSVFQCPSWQSISVHPLYVL